MPTSLASKGAICTSTKERFISFDHSMLAKPKAPRFTTKAASAATRTAGAPRSSAKYDAAAALSAMTPKITPSRK
jgi:hypothetical protein